MASLNLDENHALYQIRSFKPGLIQINDHLLTENVIVSPSQLIENWKVSSVSELNLASFAAIFALKPDILLIGTGTNLIFLAPDLYVNLLNQGIGVEVMDTSAACRTYNVLSAEERNVIAALFIK